MKNELSTQCQKWYLSNIMVLNTNESLHTRRYQRQPKVNISTPSPTAINQCQKAISSQTVQHPIIERERAPKVHTPILIENFPAFPVHPFTALLHHLLYSLKPHYIQYFGFCAFFPPPSRGGEDGSGAQSIPTKSQVLVPVQA